MVEGNTFFEIFTGGLDLNYFVSYIIWGYLGMFLNLLIEIFKRKPSSTTSPKKLNGLYYLSDNKKRLIIAVILVPIAVIMFKELFGMEPSNEKALMMGFGADTLAEMIKRKSKGTVDVTKYA